MGDLQEAGAGAVLDAAMEADAVVAVAGGDEVLGAAVRRGKVGGLSGAGAGSAGGSKPKAVSGGKAKVASVAVGAARGARQTGRGRAKTAGAAAKAAGTPTPTMAANTEAASNTGAKTRARAGTIGVKAAVLAKGRAGAVKDPASRPNKRQMRLFLDELAETSNITASARAAGLGSSSFYRERRRSGEFADAWHEALCEGFVRLETELLSEALVQPSARVNDATLKARAQKYRLGLALLSAHRAAVRGAGRREVGAAAGKEAATGQARQKLGDKLRHVQKRAQGCEREPEEGPVLAGAGFDAAGDDAGGAFDL